MLKSSDIARELHVSEQTVRAYARDGLIPFVETPGGHRRFVLEDVRASLHRARKRTLDPLSEEESPRLASHAPAAPLRRARRTRSPITRATIAEAHEFDEAGPIHAPFIGQEGSSRFVVGQGVPA